ncbi:MAG: DNA polymerase III subunit alpha, partial [Planctomycetota bacterium]|nr:DNA polymerase III subunit alpha [Planctomycetota bacterium]
LCRLITARQLDGGGPGVSTDEEDDDSFDLIQAATLHQEGLFFLVDHPRLLLGLYGRVPSERLFAAISPGSLRLAGRERPVPRGAERNTHLSPTRPEDVSNLVGATREDALDLPKCPPPAQPAPAMALIDAARAVGAAILAVPDVYHAFPQGKDDHRIRIAIKHNALLEGLPEAWVATQPAHLPTAAEMDALYEGLPDVPGSWEDPEHAGPVRRTLLVAERCRFTPALGGVIFPEIDLEEGQTPYSRLCELAFEGARHRYRPLRPEVVRRLDYELSTIHRLGFAPYFLLVDQIAEFARAESIPSVGRGSAADSLVAYCLRLTDADPFRYRLPFERFLNPTRRDRPDVDLDFCWRRRDEVLEHVYELFGAERTAMICTLNKFGLRSAFREAALVHGIPPAEINPWASRLPMYFGMGRPPSGEVPDDESSEGFEEKSDDTRNPTGAAPSPGRPTPPRGGGGGGPGGEHLAQNPLAQNPLAQALRAAPGTRDFPFDDARFAAALEAAANLLGAPRHFGLHPGGVVVAPGRITDIVACQYAAKLHPGSAAGSDERPAGRVVVTQLDKDAIEAIGLVKMDLLGNRALTTIDDCCRLLAIQGIEVDPSTVPENDPATASTLREGRTLGCFQVESPGMRNLLQQIGAATMDDVIQAVALIRPGPAGSGMKDAYIRRSRGLEPATPPHPRLVDVLWDTHGVMLYQEDVMQAAARVAGMDMSEADLLRRALQKRRDDDLTQACGRFLAGAEAEGVTRTEAQSVWDLIANFASFAFCKAHAVTYGRIAYRAAWLKTHYPATFLVAFLASETGYYPARVYIEEARRLGVPILPPDVNRSGATFDVEALSPRRGDPPTLSLRIGLSQVKGLSERTLAHLLSSRKTLGAFLSLPDFLDRTDARVNEVEALIQCGAFDAYDRTRPELLWRLHLLKTPAKRAPKGAGLDPRLLDACQVTPARTQAEVVRAARSRKQVGKQGQVPATDRPLSDSSSSGWSGRGIGVSQAELVPGREAALFPDPGPETLVLPGLPDLDRAERGRLEFELLGLCIHEHPVRLFPCPADGRLAERFGRKAGAVSGAFHSRSAESDAPGGDSERPPRPPEAKPVRPADLRPVNPIRCGDLALYRGGRVTLRGWPAATRGVRTEDGHAMRFLTLEDESGLAEVVLFPDIYRRDGQRLHEEGVLCVTGVVEDQYGACTLTAERVW